MVSTARRRNDEDSIGATLDYSHQEDAVRRSIPGRLESCRNNNDAENSSTAACYRSLRASLCVKLLSAVLVLVAARTTRRSIRCVCSTAVLRAQANGMVNGVLINYWVDWCSPCREEVPELNQLNGSDDGFTVLGVNYDYLQGGELQRLSMPWASPFRP